MSGSLFHTHTHKHTHTHTHKHTHERTHTLSVSLFVALIFSYLSVFLFRFISLYLSISLSLSLSLCLLLLSFVPNMIWSRYDDVLAGGHKTSLQKWCLTWYVHIASRSSSNRKNWGKSDSIFWNFLRKSLLLMSRFIEYYKVVHYLVVFKIKTNNLFSGGPG